MIIAKKGMYLGQVSSFIQNLSAVKFDTNSMPVGMVDSVSANDSSFRSGNCFIGDGESAFNIGDIAEFKTPTFYLSFYIEARNTTEMTQYIFSNHFTATNGFAIRLEFNSFRIYINSSIVTNVNLLEGGRYFIEMNTITGTSMSINAIDLDTMTVQNYTFTIPAITYTNGTTCAIGGRFISNWLLSTYCKIWDFTFDEYDSSGLFVKRLGHWPIPFPIVDENNHIEYDVSDNGYNAVLVGDLSNNSTIDRVTYYSNFGWGLDTNNLQVPVLESNKTIDVNGNSLIVDNDGAMWLNNGSTMQNTDTQELKDKDIYNVWYDALGTPKDVPFAELETAIFTYPEIYGGDVVAGESIKNITLK